MNIFLKDLEKLKKERVFYDFQYFYDLQFLLSWELGVENVLENFVFVPVNKNSYMHPLLQGCLCVRT